MNLIHEVINGVGSSLAEGLKAEGRGPHVRLALDVTALVGTVPTMDVTVEFPAGPSQTFTFEATQPVGYSDAFAQNAAGASKETVVVANCPTLFNVRFTGGGTITDFDAKVYAERIG